jgi:hypothetical protein
MLKNFFCHQLLGFIFGEKNETQLLKKVLHLLCVAAVNDAIEIFHLNLSILVYSQ